MSDNNATSATDTKATLLLQIITELAREISHQPVTGLHLDSHLERDLGFDSLSKTELLQRVEKTFNVTLSEQALTLSTVAELLSELDNSAAHSGPESSLTNTHSSYYKAQNKPAGTSVAVPVHASSLTEVLSWYAEQQPQRTAIYLYGDNPEPELISYQHWYKSASRIAAGLRHAGLETGQRVAIMLATEADYFFSFFGILLAGGVPVPIYPPTRRSQFEEHLLRQARILNNASIVVMITVLEAKPLALLLRAQVPTLRHVMTAKELAAAAPAPLHQAQAEELAFLQYTSGSTGDPKGVMLSHANLLANIRAMVQRVAATADDVFVSWLPLYHDMGLIGACFGSLYAGMPLVSMPPLKFLHRPSSWLKAIHRHGGTLSAAPNFAYELCLRNIRDSDIEGLDLTSWRYALNGAEPVNAATMRRFSERFAQFGFSPAAVSPSFGLAENCVGLTLPEPGRGLKTLLIKQQEFEYQGHVILSNNNSAGTLEYVACGHVIPGHQIRIIADNDRELPPDREGRVQFQGPSASQGYLDNPQATDALIQGDWLETGDRGFLHDGDIYITGRSKDMIIRGGRNFYPYELEQAVGVIKGIRQGCVAVFACQDKHKASERLVIAAETRIKDPEQKAKLVNQIRETSMQLLDLPPEDVILVPPQAVLKTSSGKIRRNAVRDLYQNGTLGQINNNKAAQILRLVSSSAAPLLRRVRQSSKEWLYCAYAWLVYGLFALLLTLLMLIIPKLHWRWAVTSNMIRVALALTGTRLQVSGSENVPAHEPCILVCNHSSYADSLLLIAALPRPFAFVAKNELRQVPLLGFLLARLNTLFVERFDLQRSAADAQKIAQAVTSGTALAFFPEGTFIRIAGLLPFRMGAFSAAVQAQTSVLPAVLTGVRTFLLPGSWFFRHTSISLTIAPAVSANGDGWQATLKLRDDVRTTMLQLSAAPNLSKEDYLL